MASSKRKEVQRFNESLDGVYGRFSTQRSYPVDYMLISLPIESMESLLCTAADAFEFSNIDFEQLIQRDVDYDRVDEEIVEKYLEVGDERVLFFPPLIVAAVAILKDAPIERYESVNEKLEPEGIEDRDQQQLITTFGQDIFEVEVDCSEKENGYSIKTAVGDIGFNSYSGTFKFDRSKLKLVVIDGQHRFEALRRAKAKQKGLLDGLHMPICLVYTPAATIDRDPSETITKDLREMFVRVNKTPKVVSGHFIELLNDKSLASIAVRGLASRWKLSDEDPVKSHLQLLEWNERSDSKARTRQRAYTVTTVSILADALRKCLSSTKRGIPQSLLNLQEVQEQLEENEGMAFHQITDDKFDTAQSTILQAQLEKYVVPALDILMRESSPYQKQWSKLVSAVADIESKSAEKPDYGDYLEEVLGRFRRCGRKDIKSRSVVQQEFDSKFEELEDEQVYFRMVFQQGLIRIWADNVGINPVATASILIKALEKLVFQPRKSLFERERPYATLTLYQGTKPRVSNPGKDAWRNLLGASLLNNDVNKCLEDEINEECPNVAQEKIELLFEEVDKYASDRLEKFLEYLANRIDDDVSKQWRFKGYPQSLKDELLRLETEDKEKFDLKIDELAKKDLSEAKSKLEAKFSIEIY